MQYGGTGSTVEGFSREEAQHQYGQGCAVQISHNISTEEAHHQHGQGCAVQVSHTISLKEGAQYGLVKSSLQIRVCSTGKPKLLRGLLVYPRKFKRFSEHTK